MPTHRADTTDGWWHGFFEGFRPLFDAVPAQTTKAEVRAFIRYLGLKRRQTFLDCPCGIGRISIPFAEQGIRVTGVDFKQEYLDEVQQQARRKKLKVATVRADMRRIRYENEFDAAGNLWTSFGFFEKESDNLLAIRKMYRALKPGGKFLLHVINRDWLIKNYQPHGIFKTSKATLYELRQLDYTTSINHARCIMVNGGKRYYSQNHLRIYSLHELVAIFERVGFEEIAGYGGYRGEPVSSDCRMLFVVGRKPQD